MRSEIKELFNLTLSISSSEPITFPPVPSWDPQINLKEKLLLSANVIGALIDSQPSVSSPR